MNKKKLSLMIAAGVLAVTVVGGSLAWFTSKDAETNHFSTGSISHKIVEDFNKKGASKDLLPGDEVNKDVWIKNTGKSEALLRVKITPQWVTNEDVADNDLETDVIQLVFAENVQTEVNSGVNDTAKWVCGKDGYFYYTSILPVNTDNIERQTAQLLDAVRLSGAVTDQSEYANKEMNIIIESETVQVNKDAYREEWKITENVEGSIISMLDGLVDSYKEANGKTHVNNN